MKHPIGSVESYDAVVVGAGPNGLAAAIALAQEGLSVLVVEQHETPGGGTRSLPLTAPGFVHDVCSAVHPLGVGSPFLRSLGLERHGLAWVHPDTPLTHVIDEGHAITLERSLDRTARQLGADEDAYRRLLEPFVERFSELARDLLAPLRIPRSPYLFSKFGLCALSSMQGLARAHFSEHLAPALLGGAAAHSMLPLDRAATASFALVLAASAHAVGWPVARGGSQAIASALVSRLRELGGELVLGQRIDSIAQLPRARAVLLDLTPKSLLAVAERELPKRYRQRLQRYRYGPGVFKMDWALTGPIPWRDPRCARAGTVHLSGALGQLSRAEQAVYDGRVLASPFTLVVQPSTFDDTRAPPSMHTVWAYCHVPSGSEADYSSVIEQHIERFAPGFRALVAARHTRNAAQMERYNPNYVGGDINGGRADVGQLFFRPLARLDPYSTANPRLFICSSATPPGGGVHGMCGYWAARSVLSRVFGRSRLPSLV